jgi:hypothetical protein
MTEKQLLEIVDKAIKNFRGQADALESAIGYLFVGQQFGWRVMFFMHSQSTVRKYEKILGVKSEDVMPPLGPSHRRPVAWKALEKVSNFWKAVKGEVPGVKSLQVSK